MTLAPRRLAPALALALVAATAARPASAQPASAPQPPPPPAGTGSVDEAREHYERGLQLFRDGAFDGALTEFLRAYELAPSYRLFYFIGHTHRQLNDFAPALRAFEQYLKDGGREVQAKRRVEVEREVAQLRKRVGRLEIVASEPGAAILVDDRKVGTSPLEAPVVVNVGQRKVVAVKDGRQSPPAIASVSGDESTKVDLQLPASASASAPASAPTPASPAVAEPGGRLWPSSARPPPPERRVPWVGWAITGVLAAGAGVTGLLALSASGELKSQRDSTDATRDGLDSDKGRTTGFAVATDALAFGALVAGGVSLYLTLKPPAPAAAAAPAPALRFGVGPGSLGVSGSF
ncbi:MAG TPA: hypothetical protein VFS00_01345 [Polyangiaceae bacterium]|nr:hypothetical protein [Polyangiaceae bacterium]